VHPRPCSATKQPVCSIDDDWSRAEGGVMGKEGGGSATGWCQPTSRAHRARRNAFACGLTFVKASTGEGMVMRPGGHCDELRRQTAMQKARLLEPPPLAQLCTPQRYLMDGGCTRRKKVRVKKTRSSHATQCLIKNWKRSRVKSRLGPSTQPNR
jgi:hypothetical protein